MFVRILTTYLHLTHIWIMFVILQRHFKQTIKRLHRNMYFFSPESLPYKNHSKINQDETCWSIQRWSVTILVWNDLVRLLEADLQVLIYFVNPLSATPTKCQTQQIVWLCLTILWGWHLKVNIKKKLVYLKPSNEAWNPYRLIWNLFRIIRNSHRELFLFLKLIELL